MFTKLNRYEFRENLPEIGSFALPIFIEQAAIAFMSVISSIMVSNIGISAVSGVNLVETLNVLIQQIFMSLEIGATVVVAQFCGKNDLNSASEASVQAMFTSVSLALVLCAVMLIFPHQVLDIILGGAEQDVYDAAFTYFTCAVISFPFLAAYAISTASIRGSGSPSLSLVATIVTNVLFALLGFIFIYGFGLGVFGAGLSLIVSRAIGAAVGLFLLKFKTKTLKITRIFPKKLRWDIQKPILLIGVPACIENLIFMVGKLITQTYTVPMGTEAMAANAISNSVTNFYNIPGNTASATVIPIVGRYLGMGEKEKAKQISWQVLLLIMGIVTLMSALMAALSWPIASLFTNDPVVQREVVTINLSYYIAVPVCWVLSFVCPSILRASGDVNYTTVVAILSMMLFRVGAGYVFSTMLHMGVIGIWLAMYGDWVIRAVLFGIRYFQGKWVNRKLIR